jgi:prepilin-type processing-associated H-X9-DG protein
MNYDVIARLSLTRCRTVTEPNKNSNTTSDFYKFVTGLTMVVAALCAVAIVVTFLLPGNKPPKAYIDRVKSAGNLTSIGQAISQYCTDHQGEFPDSLATLMASENVAAANFINPATSATVATGPTSRAYADQLASPEHCSYVYLGRGLTSKTATADTIVARELLLTPTAGANFLFGDGHVEFIAGPYAAKVTARETSGTFPVTMPSL